MKWAQWADGKSDVYVELWDEGGITCMGRPGPFWEDRCEMTTLASDEDVREHLRAHRETGDVLPDYLEDMIIEDVKFMGGWDKVNNPVAPSGSLDLPEHGTLVTQEQETPGPERRLQ